jgi:hypothetical protein
MKLDHVPSSCIVVRDSLLSLDPKNGSARLRKNWREKKKDKVHSEI